MSTAQLSIARARVVCEFDASSGAKAIVKAASSYCRERDAELVIVWVFDPEAQRPMLPGAAGGLGTWGLLGALGPALDLARREGIVARAVVRVGERGRVLEEERRAAGAERVFTRADVPVVRCPACGTRLDHRAVHFCPAVHLERTSAREIGPSAA